MFKSEKGFSLVQVMIAAGILGGLTLVFMRLTKNMHQAQDFAQSKSDELELRSSIRIILDDKKHCRISLAGEGPKGSPISPVKFNKEDIDETNEGLDIELFLSNQQGDTRLKKKYSATDSQFNSYRKLDIKSMKLIMNNGTGFNYSESPGHSDIGQITVTLEKDVSSTQKRELTYNFDVNVGMETDASGESTILTCSTMNSSSGNDPLADREWHILYDGSEETKSFVNNFGKTIFVMAFGGQDSGSINSCAIRITSPGVPNIGVVNNNNAYSKNCMAVHFIPDGEQFTVDANPYFGSGKLKVMAWY